MSKKKKNEKSNKSTSILLLLGFVLAVGILLYPDFVDSYSSIQQTVMLGGYQSTIADMDIDGVSDIEQKAIEYNKKIEEEQKETLFKFMGENVEDEEYRTVLRPTPTTDVMGSIEIPKINVYLPITHGTRSEDLEFMIGHMFGSSVPIGGESTHAVLTGHTGLQNVSLFTDLDDLEIGDVFYIHVLNEIHVYTVDHIKIVLPGKDYPYLQIEEGRDYITLFTCTPYGVNDHRLLVRGVRTLPDLELNVSQDGISDVQQNYSRDAIIKTIAYGATPVLILVIGLIVILRKKKKDPDEENENKTSDQAKEEAIIHEKKE